MASLLRWYDRTITTLVFVAFSTMLVAALAGTVSRYGSFFPRVSWGEEVTRFSGIWAVFLVSGYSIRQGAHLGVDLLTRLLPPRRQRAVAIVVYLLMLGFAAILLIYGLKLAFDNMRQTSPSLQWSMGMVYLCIPIGAALMIGETVGVIVRTLRGRPAHLPSTMGSLE